MIVVLEWARMERWVRRLRWGRLCRGFVVRSRLLLDHWVLELRILVAGSQRCWWRRSYGRLERRVWKKWRLLVRVWAEEVLGSLVWEPVWHRRWVQWVSSSVVFSLLIVV